jgi:exonuclease III
MAIVQSKADVILLSDTRVVSTQGVSSTERIANWLRSCKVRQYTPFFNSSMNSRGTAILFACSLDLTFNKEYRDINENYYVVDVSIAGRRLCIGSVYGPNGNGRDFFNGLNNVLQDIRMQNNGNPEVILGGDWNTTWDRREVANNIDIHCMSKVPNQKNSELLENMCESFSLIDPFRALYPFKKDFTYIPFGNIRLNRSRLDFFVISHNIIPEISDCTISSSVSGKMFDHKQVVLSINEKQASVTNAVHVSNSFLDEKLMCIAIEIAARRVAIYSLDLDSVEVVEGFGSYAVLKANELRRISDCSDITKRIVKFMEQRAIKGADVCQNLNLQISGLETDALLQIDDMYPLNDLYKLDRRCSAGEFFEALIRETRDACVKIQKTLTRFRKLFVGTIENKLTALKDDFLNNNTQIGQLENIFKNHNDMVLRERTLDMKIFECLHAEKVSPLLLNLAKKGHGCDKLSNIKNDAGVDFENNEERGRHISDFYRKLYLKDDAVSGSIEEFLGVEICSHPTVTGSKLRDDEREVLDRPLEIVELDQALREANLKLAPGIDGFSYRFITKFWYVYRAALFDTAKEGLENGGLPEFFMTAKIKLIPKKGDVSKVKNWRPISLLSNFFKIISRLINTRLQVVVDRILSRAQKGFTKSRQIQEVIINCMETMNYCRKNNIKGVIASIDQSKAFDSVDHKYMEKVYEFFGFGERIQRWLKSIGTNRKACIQLENNKTTDTRKKKKKNYRYV